MSNLEDALGRVDRPRAQLPETRAAAVAYLERTGNADVAEALGLTGTGPLVIDGKPCCPVCRFPYRGDGRTSCRRRKCAAGPSYRSGS